MTPAWPLPDRLDLPLNRGVAEVLAAAPLYAHSDLSDPLAEIDRRLAGRGVGRWFPSPREYSYELRHSEAGVVFLVAYGMRGLSLRLGEEDAEAALAAGAEPDGVFGLGWLAFRAFTDEAERLLFDWAERALDYVESL